MVTALQTIVARRVNPAIAGRGDGGDACARAARSNVIPEPRDARRDAARGRPGDATRCVAAEVQSASAEGIAAGARADGDGGRSVLGPPPLVNPERAGWRGRARPPSASLLGAARGGAARHHEHGRGRTSRTTWSGCRGCFLRVGARELDGEHGDPGAHAAVPRGGGERVRRRGGAGGSGESGILRASSGALTIP